jgi:hypothetical protein
MKTSLVAVLGASLFLIAALIGLGSGHASPPSAPQMIVLAGPATGPVGVPASPLLPEATPTATAAPNGLPGVVAVGRTVQQKSLQDLLAPGPESSQTPPVSLAAGPSPVPGGPPPIQVYTTFSPAPNSPPPNGSPAPYPTYAGPPPQPTGSPAFTFPTFLPPLQSFFPTPSPSVTGTAHPTSTATPHP